MVLPEAFWRRHDLSDLPLNVDSSGERVHEDRYYETRPDLKVHATTEDSLPHILEEGIKPRESTRCEVWPDDRVPKYLVKEGKYDLLEEILQCREEHVYFWDDYNEGVGQALGTVGFLKEGEPVVLVVKTEGLDLKDDPEISGDVEEDPKAFTYKGEVDPERIQCVFAKGFSKVDHRCDYVRYAAS